MSLNSNVVGSENDADDGKLGLWGERKKWAWEWWDEENRLNYRFLIGNWTFGAHKKLFPKNHVKCENVNGSDRDEKYIFITERGDDWE